MTFDRDTKVGIVTDVYDKPQKGGIAYYTQRLVKALKKIIPSQLCLIHTRKSADPFYKEVQEIICPGLPIIKGHYLPNPIAVSKFLKKANVGLIHIPSARPFQTPYLLLKNIKYVATIHSLALWHKGRKFASPNLLKWIYDEFSKAQVSFFKNKMDRYIAVSRKTKEEAMKFLKIPESKIKVIYEAPDEVFRPIKEIKLQIPDINSPYILSDEVSQKVVKIYSKLRKMGIKHKLLIFGRGEKKSDLFSLIENLNLKKEIIFSSYIPTKELVELYNGASLFLHLVSFEGFGLTPLEAMACGCPVIASNVGSLPEVVGEAGILVDPNNTKEWVEKIYYILTHEDFRQELIQKGLEQAKKFSWEKAAKETIKVYEEVLNENSSS